MPKIKLPAGVFIHMREEGWVDEKELWQVTG
jgi:hypothetical protein